VTSPGITDQHEGVHHVGIVVTAGVVAGCCARQQPRSTGMSVD
jgi:hypothetical protein